MLVPMQLITTDEAIQILRWSEEKLIEQRAQLGRQMSRTWAGGEAHKTLLDQDTKLANEIKSCMAQISALGGCDD